MSTENMFTDIPVNEINLNPFSIVRDNWAVLAAEDNRGINAMTIGWIGFGTIWDYNTVTVFVKPERYTKSFVDNADHFSVTLFDGYKRNLAFLGSRSGKDSDKITESGLHMCKDGELITFEEGTVAFLCKKVFCAELDNQFFDKSIDERIYKNGLYHTMYIGGIERIVGKQKSALLPG